MPKTPGKKITVVRAHPRRVPVSPKNPTGTTIVDRHLRRTPGAALDAQEIRSIRAAYDKNGLVYPSNDDLEFPDGSKYDELIAIWVDYFNKKLGVTPPHAPLDPDIVKALIASESAFKTAPKNPKAIGIAQITPETLEILLNTDGEAKDFVFKGIRQKDLKDPEIAIPMAVRWIIRKRQRAAGLLKRSPTPEEIILEYKGLSKSTSDYKNNAVKSFRKYYGRLKKS